MVLVSTRYEFTQHFDVPAAKAFKWCIDYDPKDHNLMGNNGYRKVTWVADDTVLLEDTIFHNGRGETKKKVIRIDRENMIYFNFHLTGGNKNSIYFYRIIPEGKTKSRLEYTGYELTYPKKAPSKKQLAASARADDASRFKEWGLLAKAMKAEVG